MGVSETAQARLDRILTTDEAHAEFYERPDLFELGWSIAFAGDVNGDGFEDLLIGSALNDDNGFESGKAFLLLGQRGGIESTHYLDDMADAIFFGAEPNDLAGWSLSSAGDLDADGYGDFLIGAYGAFGQRGATHIYYGGPDMGKNQMYRLDRAPAVIVGENGGDATGFSLAHGGDINGDGFSDIILSGHKEDITAKNAGAAYIFFGGAQRWEGEINVSEANIIIRGASGGLQFANKVAGGFDVNGDLYDDMLLGTPRADPQGRPDAGAVYLYLGGESIPPLMSSSDAEVILGGEATTNNLGVSCALVSDMHGDGLDEILAGTMLHSDTYTYSGKGYLVPGQASWEELDTPISQFTQISGNGELDYAGAVVAAAGDLDGDHLGDFLVSAHYADTTDINNGEISIFYAGVEIAPHGTLADAPAGFAGKHYGELAGASLATGGDFDGDGYPDIAVGQPGKGSISLYLMGRYIDEDRDGVRVVDGDCNDHNYWIGPGFTEYCDGLDNNCDQVVDENCSDETPPTPEPATPYPTPYPDTPFQNTPIPTPPLFTPTPTAINHPFTFPPFPTPEDTPGGGTDPQETATPGSHTSGGDGTEEEGSSPSPNATHDEDTPGTTSAPTDGASPLPSSTPAATNVEGTNPVGTTPTPNPGPTPTSGDGTNGGATPTTTGATDHERTPTAEAETQSEATPTPGEATADNTDGVLTPTMGPGGESTPTAAPSPTSALGSTTPSPSSTTASPEEDTPTIDLQNPTPSPEISPAEGTQGEESPSPWTTGSEDTSPGEDTEDTGNETPGDGTEDGTENDTQGDKTEALTPEETDSTGANPTPQPTAPHPTSRPDNGPEAGGWDIPIAEEADETAAEDGEIIIVVGDIHSGQNATPTPAEGSNGGSNGGSDPADNPGDGGGGNNNGGNPLDNPRAGCTTAATWPDLGGYLLLALPLFARRRQG